MEAGRRRRALVVNPDAASCLALKRVLERDGFEVECCLGPTYRAGPCPLLDRGFCVLVDRAEGPLSTAVIALPPGAGFTTEILEAYRPLFGQVVIFDEGAEPRQAGALAGLAQAEADELRAWMRMIPVALAAAADPRGPAHPSGPSRVVWTALQVLKRLDPDAAAHPITQFGLLLRDIGVLAGGLSEGTMEHHPVRGAEILSGIPPLVEAIPIVRHHHERFDGTGYPDRLVGRKIPSACRAVAVAEAFDARGASGGGLERAAADLRNDRGGAYDPEAVDILLDLVERDALGLNPSGNAVGDRPGAEEGGGV